MTDRHECGLDRTYCNRCSTELEVGQVGACGGCRGPSAIEAIAWESTTPFFTQFVSDRRYRLFSHKVQACYRPYRCSNCSSQTGSIGGLRKHDLTAVAGHVDERIAVAATGAKEVDPVAVDLGLNGLKHGAEIASPASPHSNTPIACGDGTPAAKVALLAARAVADHFSRYEQERGSKVSDRFRDPLTHQTRDNGVTIPVPMLRALVAAVQNTTTQH